MGRHAPLTRVFPACHGQALAQILGMFSWHEELGHWTVHPVWQNWLDEVMALRQQQAQTD